MAIELPKNYDEFDDQRRASFIKAMNFKEDGGRLIGYLCSYAPLEIVDAAGASAVGLCGTNDVTIPDAEKVLPKNLCPLIKGTFGFAYTETCPFTYFSDFVIGETTCDGKKKMFELLNDYKETYVMQLPQGQGRPWAKDVWREECRLLKEKLEQTYDITITDDDLREAAKTRNELRHAICDLYEMQAMTPPPMSGVELLSTINAGNFNFNVKNYIANLQALYQKKMADYEAGNRPISTDAKRILITGCPSFGTINKTIKAIEENGGVVVCFDDCSGPRTQSLMVDPEADDILGAIADRYLGINCSVMTPNEGRRDNTAEMCEKYKVDGIVDIVLQACHTFNVEAEFMRRKAEEIGIPYMKIETDYSQNDKGQLETRLAAFIEML